MPFKFFKLQSVWMPTVWGWILIILTGIFGLGVAAGYIHSFLAPIQPNGARLLIVEGWLESDALDQAIRVFRNGGYDEVITTGGPIPVFPHQQIPTTYAAIAQDYLIRHGIPKRSAFSVPAPRSAQDRTYLSAVMVRDWLKLSGRNVKVLDVFSLGVHGRRSRMLYRFAFGPSVTIGIISAKPTEYDPAAWWLTSSGAKTVITEFISWIWTALLFNPGPTGSREEQWGPNPA